MSTECRIACRQARRTAIAAARPGLCNEPAPRAIERRPGDCHLVPAAVFFFLTCSSPQLARCYVQCRGMRDEWRRRRDEGTN